MNSLLVAVPSRSSLLDKLRTHLLWTVGAMHYELQDYDAQFSMRFATLKNLFTTLNLVLHFQVANYEILRVSTSDGTFSVSV